MGCRQEMDGSSEPGQFENQTARILVNSCSEEGTVWADGHFELVSGGTAAEKI